MEPLDLAIQFSDLFEATETEGGDVAYLIDTEIIPYMREHLAEADGIGLGQRFSKILDRVQTIVNQSGSDQIRALKEMMKRVLSDYVKRTSDALTARHIFHNAIMQGKDTMLTVSAAGLLANALAGQHPQQATQLMQQVGSRLTGERPMSENSSGAAVSAGAIATTPTGLKAKKRRRGSIFAEGEVIQDPHFIDLLREIANGTANRPVDGVLVDPTTAELVLAAHTALNPAKRRQFENKSISEMIRIANRLFEQGEIEIIVEEE